MGQDVVRCTILGQTEISVGGIRLTPEAERQFGVALYFCANAGREIPRDDVAALFWPEHNGDAARHCLRQTLYRLRVLGVPVRSGAKSISLDERAVEADHTPVVVEGAPSGAYLALTDVTVLPGYVPRFSPPFARWVEEFRSDVGARVRRGLVRAIADTRTRGRYAEVERLARHCLVLDPLNEEATLALAEAIALAGGKAEAVGMIEQYDAKSGDEFRNCAFRAPCFENESRMDSPAPIYPRKSCRSSGALLTWSESCCDSSASGSVKESDISCGVRLGWAKRVLQMSVAVSPECKASPSSGCARNRVTEPSHCPRLATSSQSF